MTKSNCKKFSKEWFQMEYFDLEGEDLKTKAYLNLGEISRISSTDEPTSLAQAVSNSIETYYVNKFEL